jgi:hypothetical protein
MPKNQIYVNKRTDELLGKVAKQKSTTKSAVLNSLVDQTGLGLDDVKGVALLIPVELLTDNEDKLHDWLSGRAVGILRHFYPE